jgi:hypothetical protein
LRRCAVVLRGLFAAGCQRIVWVAISAAAVAGAAFVFTVAMASAVVIAVRGQDIDPDELAAVATPLGLVAAVVAVAAMAAVWRAVGRARVRRWLPVYEAMVHDAICLQDTYLVETVTPPDPAASGHVVAADLHAGTSGGLWLPDVVLPRGAVVCFTQTAAGPRVRSWMTRSLWRAGAPKAARIGRRAATA